MNETAPPKPTAKPDGDAPSAAESRLAARRDGAFLDAAAARELWAAFSAHMDAHRGDEAGFAKARGCAVVRAEFEDGRAVLSLFTTAEAAAKTKPAEPPRGRGAARRNARGGGRPGQAKPKRR